MYTCSSQECNAPFSIYELGIVIAPSILTLSKFIMGQFITPPPSSQSLIPSFSKYIFIGLAIYVIVYAIRQYASSTTHPHQSPCLSYCFLCKHRTTRQTLGLVVFLFFSLILSMYNIHTILITNQRKYMLLLFLNLASMVITWSLFLRSLYV